MLSPNWNEVVHVAHCRLCFHLPWDSYPEQALWDLRWHRKVMRSLRRSEFQSRSSRPLGWRRQYA